MKAKPVRLRVRVSFEHDWPARFPETYEQALAFVGVKPERLRVERVEPGRGKRR